MIPREDQSRLAEADLDALYASLAVSVGWQEPWAHAALRLVDAAWHADTADFAAQAWMLRCVLEASSVRHDARRVIAGLSIMRAQRVVANLHDASPAAVHGRLRVVAGRAKVEHVFPWHLLDG